jgi:hypothetical protein
MKRLQWSIWLNIARPPFAGGGPAFADIPLKFHTRKS